MEHIPVFSIHPVSAEYPEPEDSRAENRRWVVVRANEVILPPDASRSGIVISDPLPSGVRIVRTPYLGCRDDVHFYAAETDAGEALPPGWTSSGVRDLYGRVDDKDLALAAYAVRILDFDRSTVFCGRCGAKTRPLRTERAKLCTDCNRITYPKISPAIIVLITREDEVLLARSPRFPGGIMSVIAGFVEPGENLEQAVVREVREEVGIEVRNIRYFGSEPWPFPDSLMIGFVAGYAGGDLTIDNNEIECAGWFSRDNLPPLPSQMSISRALIDAWIRRDI